MWTDYGYVGTHATPPSLSAPKSHGKLRSMLTGTGVGSNFRFVSHLELQPAEGEAGFTFVVLFENVRCPQSVGKLFMPIMVGYAYGIKYRLYGVWGIHPSPDAGLRRRRAQGRAAEPDSPSADRRGARATRLAREARREGAGGRKSAPARPRGKAQGP